MIAATMMRAVLLAAAFAAAEPSVDEHLERAETLFAQGQFQASLDELDAAQAVEARPEILFMQGRCLRYLERCDEAVQRYREFLATSPPAEAVTATRADLEKCGAAELPASEPAPAAEPVPPPPPHVAPTAGVATAPEPRRAEHAGAPIDRSRERGNLALIGVGASLAAVGVGLGVGGGVTVQRSTRAPDVETYNRDVRRGQIAGGIGWSLAGVGAAVLVAGVIRLVVARRNGSRS